MFDHISLGVSDLVRSIALYDQLMDALGYSRFFGSIEEKFIAYGDERGFLVINTPLHTERGAPIWCNGAHYCLRAPSRETVDEFHRRAIEMGAQSDGEPGIRPEYDAEYYAAYILDYDAHKIEALHMPRTFIS